MREIQLGPRRIRSSDCQGGDAHPGCVPISGIPGSGRPSPGHISLHPLTSLPVRTSCVSHEAGQRKGWYPVSQRDRKELWQKRLGFAFQRGWGAEAEEVAPVTLTRVGHGEELEDEVSGLTCVVLRWVVLGLRP